MVTSWLCMRHSSGHRTQRPAGILPNRTGFSITAGSLPFQNGQSPLNHALAARLDVIKSRALAAAVRWPHHQVSATDCKADHHGLQEWSTGSNRLSLPVQAPLSPATLAANLLPVTHIVSLAQHLLTADAATYDVPGGHRPHPLHPPAAPSLFPFFLRSTIVAVDHLTGAAGQEVCNNVFSIVTILGQHCANTNIAAICVNDEQLACIRVCQY